MPDNIRFDITDNSDAVGAEFELRALHALEECGLVAEGYAKQLAPGANNKVGSTGGTLKNSITHQVMPDEHAVYIGTNVEYAVYQELGTGKYAEGGGGRPTPWVYQDAKGNWHKTSGNKPHPFIKPALADHIQDYRTIIESELKG